MSKAGAPTDLVLDSTGSTLSASWGHGVGAEYYHAIPSTSPAVNQGLYVKREGTTSYYSKEGKDNTWYTKPDLSGTPESSLPNGVKDLTATDATGYARKDKPDLGAYEYR